MSKMFPVGFSPQNRLPKKVEDLIRQAMCSRQRYASEPRLGSFFMWDALDQLISLCDFKTKEAAEARSWMLIAHINTEDTQGFRSHINYWFDWERQCPRGIQNVSKFIPGQHFHTMGTKFDSLAEAVEHIEKNGGMLGRIIEQHFYSNEGD
jgi:hypothetical protein